MKIIILDDNEDRRAMMRSCLGDRFFSYDIQIFDDPAAMIDFLKEHLSETIVLCLDHDLELKPGPSGEWLDPGSGRQVADYLAGQPAVCPVVIHSTNVAAAVGMEMVLREAGWETRRVLPFEDLDWISRDWFRAVRRAILGMARPAVSSDMVNRSRQKPAEEIKGQSNL